MVWPISKGAPLPQNLTQVLTVGLLHAHWANGRPVTNRNFSHGVKKEGGKLEAAAAGRSIGTQLRN